MQNDKNIQWQDLFKRIHVQCHVPYIMAVDINVAGKASPGSVILRYGLS